MRDDAPSFVSQPVERRLARWWAARAIKLNLRPSVFAVVAVIVTRSNGYGVSWPSRKTIMSDAGIRSRETFDRALRRAVDVGLLRVERMGRRLTNRYHVGPALAGDDGLKNGPSHDVTECHRVSQDVTDNRGDGLINGQVTAQKIGPKRAKGMINTETRKPAPPVCPDSPPKAARRGSHSKKVNGDETQRPFGAAGVN